jgi:DNA-binding transcriptional LysR family regulator
MLPAGLRYFLAVAECGSMREAAERLRIAQSAVSRQILKLEQELGSTLLERRPRGVVLTPAGDMLLQHAREQQQLADRLHADLEAMEKGRSGHVLLRSVESFAGSTLPSVLTRFRARHPAVTVEVAVVYSEEVLDGLLDGSCHLGLSSARRPSGALDTLAAAPEPTHVLLAPGHPLAHERRIELPQLMPFPIVAPTRSGSSRVAFDAACRADGISFQVSVETNSVHVAAGMARESDCVALFPASAAGAFVAAGTLVAVPLANPILSGGLVILLKRRGRSLPPAAESLARALATALAHRT